MPSGTGRKGASNPGKGGVARRPEKGSGEKSYDAYLRRLASASEVRRPQGPARSWAFVATCTGSTRLGREIGLPLACVDVAVDPLARVKEMSASRHGALVPGSSDYPFAAEAGWDDWSLVHLMPEMVGRVRLGSGIKLQDGTIAVETDRCVPLAEVRLALADALRHLRFHEFAASGDAVRARHAAGGLPFVVPRYTSVLAFGDAAGRRVDDVYAFDAWRGLDALALCLESALLRARAQIIVEP